jgi:hypothetical protein
MLDLIILLVHVLATAFRVVRPGGVRAVIAESVLTKTSIVDPQSFAPACPESAPSGRVVLRESPTMAGISSSVAAILFWVTNVRCPFAERI